MSTFETSHNPIVEPDTQTRQAPRWGTATHKSPALACVLSLMPGLGQVYLGYYGLGFIHAVVFAGTITLLSTGDVEELTPLFSIFLAFFYLYNIVDAGRRAVHVNQVRAGIEDAELPRDIRIVGPHGSVGLGIVLLAAGLVLLSRTAFDMPLDWLEDWWPVIPMLFGIYLIGRELRERAGKK